MSGTAVSITLPGGQTRQVPPGTTVEAVVTEPDAVAASVDGILVDLKAPLTRDARVEAVTFDSQEGREVYRHTSAHVMAQAVKRLFPEARIAIGPATEEGFYYDIDLERSLTPEDLKRIEEEMHRIIREDLPIVREELSRQEAIRLFRDLGETYKVEILEEIPEGETISVYRQGEFVDLCRGPHLPSTGRLGAVKLLSVAGAYWRGDERNPMLQRIYGTAFPTAEALQAHLNRLEEIKRRDHRRLGRELDLFSVHEEAGAGLILWHPKGALVRKLIEDFWREAHLQRGYELVYTPHIARLDLWKTSGHLDFYQENMYAPMEVEGIPYQLKPMNCPFHILIYRAKTRSYRELPIRWAELGTVYRHERSGVLHGLMRVRGFTQDDAHIFCRPDQLEDEIVAVLELSLDMLQAFGFEAYEVYLATRPEKFVGSAERWDQATQALEQALRRTGLAYRVDAGGGAFYGPKIDLKIKDCLGRPWQCGTVQFDFNLPERFQLTYVDEHGSRVHPYLIHRALLGSLERFFGILVEHYAGAFPVWLAPEQVRVLAIADRHRTYGERVVSQLRSRGLRVQADFRNEKMGFKVREATLAKVPYLLVVGDREVEQETVSVRTREGQNLGSMPLEAFAARVQEEARPERRRRAHGGVQPKTARG